MVSGMIEAAKLLCHQLSRVSLSFALSDMHKCQRQFRKAQEGSSSMKMLLKGIRISLTLGAPPVVTLSLLL